MGVTSRHLSCFVPEDTAKWKVLFYNDVAPHQQHICLQKKTRNRDLLLAVCTLMQQQQQVNLVAGDFNGASWRRQSGSHSRSLSSIEEALVNMNLPLSPGSTPLGRPGGVPGKWSDLCGFSKPPGSENEWQVSLHGVFTIPYGMLGLRETDQSCHQKVWIHFLHVNARFGDRISQEDKSRRPHPRKRNSPYDHSNERRQHR